MVSLLSQRRHRYLSAPQRLPGSRFIRTPNTAMGFFLQRIRP